VTAALEAKLRGGLIFLPYGKLKVMADIEKSKKRDKKVERTTRHGERAQSNASGVPSSGGSRQGNIGHQGHDNSDNSHR
jgi:hypothetical protein